RFPSGYLVIGDAVCSFNPIYGQGMSVAATEAQALEACLAAGLDGLSRRVYPRGREIVGLPLGVRAREGLRFPPRRGQAPPGFRAHQPIPRACARRRVVRSVRLPEVLRRAEPAGAAAFIDVAERRLARAGAPDAQR